MTIVENLKAISRKLAGATESITAEIQRMRAGIEEKRSALKAAQRSAVDREELATRIREIVARDAAAWLRGHSYALVGAETAIASRAPRAAQIRLPDAGAALMEWGGLCAANSAEAIARLTALVQAAGYQAGPSREAYTETVTRLTRELSELEAAEESTIDQAAEAGLQIQHRPEVARRRQDEARRAQLEAERTEDRDRRQQELDRVHGERVGPSSYLRSGLVGAEPGQRLR
jgi:hypothetical protein